MAGPSCWHHTISGAVFGSLSVPAQRNSGTWCLLLSLTSPPSLCILVLQVPTTVCITNSNTSNTVIVVTLQQYYSSLQCWFHYC